MRIDRIELTGFRCFEKLAIDFAEQVTLLVGINGAGKTSLLAALRTALAPWVAAFDPTLDPTAVDPDDIRRVTVDGAPERALPLTVRAEGRIDDAAWHIEAASADGRALSITGDLVQRARATRDALAAAEPTHLPLFAVVGARVGMRDDPTEPDDDWLRSRAAVYRHALSGGLRMPALVQWLKWREESLTQTLGARLEALGDEAAEKLLAGDFPDFATAVRALTGVERPAELEGISAAACAVLPGARSVRYHIGSGAVRVDFDDGRVLPLALLSDGTRRLVGLAMRLAWMAVRLNPTDGADAPRRIAGVVLLDEVELHLHPLWQREILPRLTAAFPNVQFIATTHSPQVVSTARAEWVRVIAPDSVRAVGKVRGRDSNALLRAVFGAPERPGWMEAKLAALEAAIEGGDVERARALLGEVRADMGDDDATVLGLEWELRDAETYGAAD